MKSIGKLLSESLLVDRFGGLLGVVESGSSHRRRSRDRTFVPAEVKALVGSSVRDRKLGFGTVRTGSAT